MMGQNWMAYARRMARLVRLLALHMVGDLRTCLVGCEKGADEGAIRELTVMKTGDLGCPQGEMSRIAAAWVAPA
jgi:hypothetical protein